MNKSDSYHSLNLSSLTGIFRHRQTMSEILFSPSVSLAIRVISFHQNFFIKYFLHDKYIVQIVYCRMRAFLDSLYPHNGVVHYRGASLHHNIFNYCFQLSDIVPVCSGCDYREQDPTLVYQYIALCANFFPCPFDFVQQFLLPVELSS